MSKEITVALKENADLNPTSNTTLDSRINIFADDPASDGLPYSYGDGSGAVAASMSSLIWGEAPPLPLLTAAYTYLNRGAAARGWTSEDAVTILTEGITMSYASLSNAYGVDITADALAYAVARVADVCLP